MTTRRQFIATTALAALGGVGRFHLPEERMPNESTATEHEQAIIWRRWDDSGMEHCRITETAKGVDVTGIVLIADAGVAHRIDYVVHCDPAWRTRGVSVRASDGRKSVEITLEADGVGHWRVNGELRDDLRGCTDVDLGFTPSTNTLPIRRLGLPVGREALVQAAWVRFPDLAVLRLDQRYVRLTDRTYRYENVRSDFRADLLVDGGGVVISYPPGWEHLGDGKHRASALFSDGRSPEIPADEDLYGWLLGAWEIDVTDYDTDGGQRKSRGEVHFAWALEGRAIQDVWIMPPRSERHAGLPVTGNRYGTTLRVYDPTRKEWRITWINPVRGVHNTLIGKRRGAEIVQEGVDESDGSLMRWRFTDIRPDAFRWLGESSSDGGKSWRVGAEFLARRTSSWPLR